MSYYSGTIIDGPSAGLNSVCTENRQIIGEAVYQHRVLVAFKGGEQSFGAWVPHGMKNTVALQKVFDGYAAWAKGQRP